MIDHFVQDESLVFPRSYRMGAWGMVAWLLVRIRVRGQVRAMVRVKA